MAKHGGSRHGCRKPRRETDPLIVYLDLPWTMYQTLESIGEQRGLSVASVTRAAICECPEYIGAGGQFYEFHCPPAGTKRTTPADPVHFQFYMPLKMYGTLCEMAAADQVALVTLCKEIIADWEPYQNAVGGQRPSESQRLFEENTKEDQRPSLDYDQRPYDDQDTSDYAPPPLPPQRRPGD